MTITGALVVFVIAWWLCFFIVLPFGVRSGIEAGDTPDYVEAGAPVNPNLKSKVKWATLAAAALTALLGASTFVIDYQRMFLTG